MTKKPSNPMTNSEVDEETFQQILSASFVIQEHNRTPAQGETTLTSAQVFSEVIAAQRQIQMGRLSLTEAMALVCDRTQRLTQADSVALGLIEGEKLSYEIYRSGAEKMVSRVAISDSLSANCLRTGQVMRYSDVGNGSNGAGLRGGSKIHSGVNGEDTRAFLAVPIQHLDKIAGVMELRFRAPQTLPEQHLHTCQLMAGLISEALSREAGIHLKQALDLERAAMLQVLDQLKPQLERLSADPAAEVAAPSAGVYTRMPALAKGVEQADAVSVPGPVAEETPATPVVVTPSQEALDGQMQQLLQSARLGANVSSNTEPERSESEILPPSVDAPLDDGYLCRGCGEALRAEEFFCGKCGTARLEVGKGSRDIQSKWASLWYMQQAAEKQAREAGAQVHNAPGPVPELSGLENLPEGGIPNGLAQFSAPRSLLLPAPIALLGGELECESDAEIPDQYERAFVPQEFALKSHTFAHQEYLEAEKGPNELSRQAFPLANSRPSTDAVKAPWTSAISTRTWLESLQSQGPTRQWLGRHWLANRANFYLGLALVLVAIAISGFWTNPSSTAGNVQTTARSKKPATVPLSPLERVLISLNLAEAPPAPEYVGSPTTQVWVDLQTALYYCPGSDLYGKTAKGKYTTQRDAQQDQFEPAYRTACK